jgi:predicted translin family RNA/ssDNA-binding protein
LCDLSGELVRVAVNEIIAENYNSVTKIRKFTAEMYEYMLGFDFRNTLLRKKFDSIKYNLEKMEDLILDLKVRDKIKGLSL